MMVIIFNIVFSINLDIIWIPLRIMGITKTISWKVGGSCKENMKNKFGDIHSLVQQDLSVCSNSASSRKRELLLVPLLGVVYDSKQESVLMKAIFSFFFPFFFSRPIPPLQQYFQEINNSSCFFSRLNNPNIINLSLTDFMLCRQIPLNSPCGFPLGRYDLYLSL